MDANDYNRKNPNVRRNTRQLPQRHSRPEHYDLLDELQESRSSRDSDKMIPK
ncbi:MAG: hypothetical protein KDD45_16050 [Bdellovibrionales bacterium]|nr:hypothetical protein [Bdellovibrionales bacterium]